MKKKEETFSNNNYVYLKKLTKRKIAIKILLL